jgi:hypothetical protein
MSTADERDHARFITHLEASKSAIDFIVDWLTELGYDCVKSNTRYAPTHADYKRFSDDGDIFIMLGGKRERLEGKKLGVTFSGHADWPFGQKFIVCAKHRWDYAEQKPYAFIVVSADWKHLGVLHGVTFRHWRVEVKTDHRYEIGQQRFYVAPTSLVRFYKR